MMRKWMMGVMLMVFTALFTACNSNMAEHEEINENSVVAGKVENVETSEEIGDLDGNGEPIDTSNMEFLTFSDVTPKQVVSLPWTVDFSDEAWTANVFDTDRGGKNWHVKTEGTEQILEFHSRKDVQTPVWADIPELYFGNESWENYKFSVDFKLAEREGSQIKLSIFIDSLKMATPDAGRKSSDFWIHLNRDGVLGFSTINGRGGEIAALSEEFDPAGWHRISLGCEENYLVVYLDGEKIGTVCETDDNEYGALGIGGSIGSCFKNIVIE